MENIVILNGKDSQYSSADSINNNMYPQSAHYGNEDRERRKDIKYQLLYALNSDDEQFIIFVQCYMIFYLVYIYYFSLDWINVTFFLLLKIYIEFSREQVTYVSSGVPEQFVVNCDFNFTCTLRMYSFDSNDAMKSSVLQKLFFKLHRKEKFLQ